VSKAKRALWGVWGMGVRDGSMPVWMGERLWTTLVRPVLEYGAEVFGEARWEEAERVQRLMARMVLGVGKGVANEVIMGDLGWWDLQARRDELRLMYWWRLIHVRDLTGEVYREMRAGEALGEWSEYTRSLLRGLGLGDVWDSQALGGQAEWKQKVQEALADRELRKWEEGVRAKSKLGNYAREQWGAKPGIWALARRDRNFVMRWRAGVNCLKVETGRYLGLPRQDRQCWFCSRCVLEDEVHFWRDCCGADEARAKFRETLGAGWRGQEWRGLWWYMKEGGEQGRRVIEAARVMLGDRRDREAAAVGSVSGHEAAGWFELRAGGY
jgi:hypothetical protein